MPLQVRVGGVWITPTALKIYTAGAWRSIQAVKIYKGGAWRDAANFVPSGGGGGGGGSLSLSVDPISAFKLGHASTLTSRTITVTPSGGLAPYSYVWSVVSQDGFATYSINSPTSATCTVTATGCPADQTVGCSIHCSVTDSLGTNAVSDTVPVTFLNQSGG